MEQISVGELVRVTTDGRALDGIVFDTPSRSKVVVAVKDRRRGPVFRVVHPNDLTEREDESPDDHALQLLIRRTPSPVHGGARGATGGGRGRAAHTRSATHRPTGR